MAARRADPVGACGSVTILARLVAAWRERRDDSLCRRRAIPETLWQQTLAWYPFLTWRNAEDLQRLRRITTLFLARKEFTGAQGFEVDDAIAVAAAVQACLPILNLGLAAYDGFVGIVMHADEVVARRETIDDDGVVHEYDESLTGEAMQGGPVMLSWRDVETAGDSAEWGYNVVIHEFAHVLDMRDGVADGVPAPMDRAARGHWQAVIDAEYTRFCAQIDTGVDTLLDPYAAQSVDEFFAVVSEVFFVAPVDLRHEHPDLYALLSGYYQQSPADHVTP